MNAADETLGAGPDVSAFESVDLAVSAAGSAGPAGGGGSDAGVPRGQALPSFALYYDMESKSVKVASPKVVSGESEVPVDVSGFDFGSRGTVVCLVWRKDGALHAKVASDGETVDGELVARVPVAEIDDPESPSGFRQLHVGAVVVGGKTQLASFAAYDNNGSIDLFEPLVATPGGIITAGGTVTGLSAGTYYCHVKRTRSGGTYAATVDTSENDSTVTSREEAVVTTKICRIGTAGEGAEQRTVVEEQYHVGTVVVDGGGSSAVDDVSIEEHNGGTESDPKPQHAIKGWHGADPSATKLGDLLTGDTEDTSRQVLVRNGKGGATEFLPIGKAGAVSVTGTYSLDPVVVKDNVRLVPESDSNVTFRVEKDAATGEVTIYVGVHYK